MYKILMTGETKIIFSGSSPENLCLIPISSKNQHKNQYKI